jgi:hypothetical protein
MPDVQCLHCSRVRNACLSVLAPRPACSRDCRKRSWRLDVYGTNASVDVAMMLDQRRCILDPLNSFKLRHLDRDIFVAASNASMPPPRRRRRALHLLWPKWERGYGDLVLSTLLPLGCELHRTSLSGIDELGISGVRYPAILAPIQRKTGLCSLEREVV